jgi:hypothetical protein
MSFPALNQLVQQIRELPGEPQELGPPRAGVATAAAEEPPTAAALRRRVGAWLAELAERVAAVLPAQLMRAAQAWDQADDFALGDDETRAEAGRLRAAADVLAASDDAAACAAGIEARLVVDAVVGLLTLLERRFAGIVRLRLRSTTPTLLVDDRPFLDVAAALSEAARAWR